MNKAELAEAIRGRGASTRKPAFVTALFAGVGDARRRVMAFLGTVFALASLGRAKPVRVLILSVSALAAGTLGLVTAYAISPDDGPDAQVLVTNGTTYSIATVTGPGGTTTVAVTKTKEGKTKFLRILESVTGPAGTETVSVQVLGPTRTTRVVVTDVRTETVREVETQEVTVTQTDTVVVTQTETVVVTETITVPQPP
jgi:hypothetical protein